ncbi:hypothetical protein A2U01_0092270, partial [Trifolium medium]|nr:hypothetical protein [Trifolium medium]
RWEKRNSTTATETPTSNKKRPPSEFYNPRQEKPSSHGGKNETQPP